MLSIASALPSLPAYCIPLASNHTMNVKVDFLVEDLIPDSICDFPCVVLNSLVFNMLVFFSSLLLLLQFARLWKKEHPGLFPSWHQNENQEVMSTSTIVSFEFGLFLCTLPAERGGLAIDSGLMGIGRIFLALLLCFLTLTFDPEFLAYLLGFCRDFFFGYRYDDHSDATEIERGRGAPAARIIEFNVNVVVVEHGGHDDDDTTTTIPEDMDWELSTNITFYTGAEPVKSKSRIVHVVRRTSPLYWRHPLLSFEEYAAASAIRSPGRSFVPSSRGQALPPIPEGVHFFPGFVSQAHLVPRDSLNEIARGRHIDSHGWSYSYFSGAGRALFCRLTEFATTKLAVGRCEHGAVDSHGWSYSYVLRAGRAWFCRLTEFATTKLAGRREIDSPRRWSILRAGRALVQFFTERASTQVAVPRDDAPGEIEQGLPTLAIVMADMLVSIDMMVPFSDSLPFSLSEIESPQAFLGVEVDTFDDDDDVQGFMFTVYDEDHTETQDVNEVEDRGVAALDFYKLSEERSNVCAEEVSTGPVVLPLRRSARIAERRQRLQLQNQESQNTIHTEVSAPDVLGSIFVDGRRRSARHLKTVKSVDSSEITCSKRLQPTRRSRCGKI